MKPVIVVSLCMAIGGCAEYGMDFDAQTIDFYCIKPIAAGEEIFINYNGDADNKAKVWFEK